MREIPLVNSPLKAMVDDEDYEYLAQFVWGCYNGYASRMIYGPPNPPRRGKMIRMHRIVLKTPGGLFTDHINHNKLDNRRSNLRIVTKSQNSQNQLRRSTPKTSQFKGVSWTKRQQRWCVQIADRWIGYFDDEVEAAKAYNEASLKLFGRYALLNPV